MSLPDSAMRRSRRGWPVLERTSEPRLRSTSAPFLLPPRIGRMPRTLRLAHVVLLLGLAGGAAACAAQPSRSAKILYVAFPPPPDPVELEGAPPSASYVWVKGHYDWNGVEYVWIPGQWEPRPYAKATWVQGRWQFTQNGWVWVNGHWS